MNLVKIDYNRMMEDEIAKFSNEKKPTLLLHSCCGPCSTTCLERLIDFFEITVFFYNPNIQPKEEFDLRLESQKKFLSSCEKMENVASKRYFSAFSPAAQKVFTAPTPEVRAAPYPGPPRSSAPSGRG